MARLFSDYRAVEKAYCRETGIFPIMQVVADRGEPHHARPFLSYAFEPGVCKRRLTPAELFAPQVSEEFRT